MYAWVFCGLHHTQASGSLLIHSLIWFLLHEAKESITTPAWIDASPSEDNCKHKVTGSITITLPGWEASPSQGTQHKVTRNITTPPWNGCLSITALSD